MNQPPRLAFGIFTCITALVAISIIAMYGQVFVRHDQYPIFTSQDQIDSAQQATFGLLARHL